MGRFALLVMGALVWIVLAKHGYSVPEVFAEKLWLVALFPAVYAFGLYLLGD